MRVKEITSQQNPFFKRLSRLKGSRGIKKYGMALLSGEKNIREVIVEFPHKCLGLITFSMEALASVPLISNLPIFLLSQGLFQSLDFHNTKSPILIVRAEKLPPWKESCSGRDDCVLFLPFQDPANIGAAIRSAAALGVRTVVILEEAASPFHPKSLRASGSTIYRLSLKRGPSISGLSTHQIPLLTLDPRGQDITQYRFPKSFGLVAGLEGSGVPERLKKADALAIPIEKGVDSLNAAVAVGIALYQWRLMQGRKA